jgi:hypothetical protein
VVAALVKLWGWSEEGGSTSEWEVGESGPPGFADGMAGVDAEIKGVLIGVAKTGSWAVWLDRATIRFRFFGPSSFNTALQLVLRPHFLVQFV